MLCFIKMVSLTSNQSSITLVVPDAVAAQKLTMKMEAVVDVLDLRTLTIL